MVNTPAPDDAAARLLDAAMDRRRLELGLRWRDVALRAGASDQALRDIRRGRTSPRALTVRKLEEALEWRAGSVSAVLGGGQPTPADGAAAGDEAAAGEPAEGGGLVLAIQDGHPVYRLTRVVDGNPLTVSQVVRDGRSREQVERELNRLLDMAEIVMGE